MIEPLDVLTIDNLIQHAKALQARRTKPGFDKMSSETALLWVQINGEHLIEDILSNRYHPMPALSFTSAKITGGFRQFGKLTVLDCIIQHCLLDSLQSQCEQFFSEHSYAYRPNRGVAMALHQYCLNCDQYILASSIDIKKCFDSIDHSILLSALNNYLDIDEKFLGLIAAYIEQPLYENSKILQREAGIIQGAPLSPILCNLYLHAADEFLAQSQSTFIRYADDIVLFSNSSQDLASLMSSYKEFLLNKLGLATHLSKPDISSPLDLTFLGHKFHRDKHGVIALQAQDSIEGTFYTWYQNKMHTGHRTVDIINDGILRQKDYSMLFESTVHNTCIPSGAIDTINVYSNVIFDSNFFQKAFDSHIQVNLFNTQGALIGRFVPHTSLRSPVVTLEQLQYYFDIKKRIQIAKQFVLSSLHNLRLNIRYYHKQRPNTVFELSLEAIKDYEYRIKSCTDYDRLLLLEAAVRKEYYSCFDFIIKSDKLLFDKRSKQPPENEINSMISYGNTILYSICANKINRSPLDVRIGFLHATNGTRLESLNLDLAEIFKPLVVDRVIFSLANMKMILPGHFHIEENGAVYLTNEGKRIFLRAFYQKLDEGLTIKDKYYTYDMLIDEEIRKLVRQFRHGEKYKGFHQER